MIKSFCKKIYQKLFPILEVQYCSQTIYQSLLMTLNMYKITKEKYWFDEAKKTKDILIKIQQNDGGWDIGYYFNFGYRHNKGESTSPELLSIVALIRFWEVEQDKNVENAIQRGIDWIISNSIRVENDWAIPYGPYSIKKVVVYNGISFAQAPLAMWAKYEKDLNRKNKLIEIYKGMNRYLEKNVVYTKDGGYMKYSIPRPDMTQEQVDKIDYYHLAQQAEMHFYANEYYPDENAFKIYKSFIDYLLYLHKTNNVIPYVNNNLFKNNVHVWGYASTLNAFILEAGFEYKKAAMFTKDWLLKYSFNKNYFYPVLSSDGLVIDKNYYPRSDAWVLHALSMYYAIEKEKKLEKIINKSYKKLSNSDFSGLENHANTHFRRLISKYLISKIKR